MKCIVFAYHDIGCEGLRALHDLNQGIAAVFTHEDDPGENVWFGSVKRLARDIGAPVHAPEDPNAPEWIGRIKELQPDILFSFYYRRMICDDILHIPHKGALNLHGSLLPKYRGRAPVNWALVNGEKETGLTLHYMIRKPDAGDIVAQRRVDISDEDTAFTLYKKLVPLTRDMLMAAVPLLEAGAAPRIPQDSSKASYFGGRRPEDGRIDWTRPAKEIYNLVRAVTHPYPGAFTTLDGGKVLVWKAKVLKIPTGSAPGSILTVDPLRIACGLDAVEVERIQTEGGAELDGRDWARGNRLKAGQILGGLQP